MAAEEWGAREIAAALFCKWNFRAMLRWRLTLNGLRLYLGMNLTNWGSPEYAVNLGNSFQSLTKNLFDPETGVIARLQSQIAVSARVNAVLSERLLRLERETNRNSQYLRKETFEIHKFPEVEKVPNAKLEEKVLEMLNAVKDEGDD